MRRPWLKLWTVTTLLGYVLLLAAVPASASVSQQQGTPLPTATPPYPTPAAPTLGAGTLVFDHLFTSTNKNEVLTYVADVEPGALYRMDVSNNNASVNFPWIIIPKGQGLPGCDTLWFTGFDLRYPSGNANYFASPLSTVSSLSFCVRWSPIGAGQTTPKSARVKLYKIADAPDLDFSDGVITTYISGKDTTYIPSGSSTATAYKSISYYTLNVQAGYRLNLKAPYIIRLVDTGDSIKSTAIKYEDILADIYDSNDVLVGTMKANLYGYTFTTAGSYRVELRQSKVVDYELGKPAGAALIQLSGYYPGGAPTPTPGIIGCQSYGATIATSPSTATGPDISLAGDYDITLTWPAGGQNNPTFDPYLALNIGGQSLLTTSSNPTTNSYRWTISTSRSGAIGVVSQYVTGSAIVKICVAGATTPTPAPTSAPAGCEEYQRSASDDRETFSSAVTVELISKSPSAGGHYVRVGNYIDVYGTLVDPGDVVQTPLDEPMTVLSVENAASSTDSVIIRVCYIGSTGTATVTATATAGTSTPTNIAGTPTNTRTATPTSTATATATSTSTPTETPTGTSTSTATATATATNTRTPTATFLPGTPSPTGIPAPPPSQPPLDDSAGVPAITPPIANLSPAPDLAIPLPTLRSYPTITVTVVISITSVVGVVQTAQFSLQTPVAAMQTMTVDFSWETGQQRAAGWATQMQPALNWLSIVNPNHPAYQSSGGPLWALAPVLLPVLPIIGTSLLIAFIRLFIWIVGWFLKLLDVIFKLLELIPGE